MAVPMSGPAMWGGVDPEATGSIARSPGRTTALSSQNPKLSKLLDAEDTRRAMAALVTALDPQGSGQKVNWDNPASGARGAFRPTGSPYPLEGRICRAFIADLEAGGDAERLEGAACRDKTAEWSLTRVKAQTKSEGSIKGDRPPNGKKA